MKKGIVLKLFILTTALCMLILATIFIGQTIFFKQYYANRKVNDIKTSIQSFEKGYLNSGGNTEAIQKLEQDFYREHNTWITTLDSNGNLKHAQDFYVKVKLDRVKENNFSDTTITFPLYYLMHIEDVGSQKLPLASGVRIRIFGIKKDSAIVPFEVQMEEGTSYWENKQIKKKLGDIDLKVKYSKGLSAESHVVVRNGTVTKVQLPQGNGLTNFMYTNDLFIERIKEFQVNLLLNKGSESSHSLQELNYEQNDIKYKLLILPIKEKNGKTTYIFSMTSLQPVDEAIQMVQDYYVYIIAFVLLLIFLASFYYSKQIARPLLQINNTTKKIANLDFSERIPITSKDEIGDLSQNINMLSNTLHSHIGQLRQDIEKERRLENTRKEFISGVSHELKTPLSIMKSCISILKDGVASHKKEYYFQAMEKEVDKMDMLIVDMLELAKFESGTYKMQMDVFYIDQIIDNICEQLSLEIAKKELNVYKHLSQIEVVANQHRIDQVIVNFITNAIRYTPEKEDIIISTIEENDKVRICVENKGTHIQAELLDKIWERFYRMDTSRQRSKGGTGLGLAISKNILELHGVQYGVSNTEDGVLFFFYLHKKL